MDLYIRKFPEQDFPKGIGSKPSHIAAVVNTLSVALLQVLPLRARIRPSHCPCLAIAISIIKYNHPRLPKRHWVESLRLTSESLRLTSVLRSKQGVGRSVGKTRWQSASHDGTQLDQNWDHPVLRCLRGLLIL